MLVRGPSWSSGRTLEAEPAGFADGLDMGGKIGTGMTLSSV